MVSSGQLRMPRAPATSHHSPTCTIAARAEPHCIRPSGQPIHSCSTSIVIVNQEDANVARCKRRQLAGQRLPGLRLQHKPVLGACGCKGGRAG